MDVRHLNCVTTCPRGGRWLYGDAPPSRCHLVGHCLLVETPSSGLLLVDTGLGLEDLARPEDRLPWPYRALARPHYEEAATALHQVQSAGFAPEDVRHIALTHLDVDHAGGLSDFPWARVHVHGAEYEAASSDELRHRMRYRRQQWAHEPEFSHGAETGEPWFGFGAVQQLEGVPPEVLMIPLPGHSQGHAGIAIDLGDRWLLHAGDAYFHQGDIRDEDPESGHPLRTPVGLRAFQRVVQFDGQLRRKNQDRLAQLAREHSGTVDVFCAHDAAEFQRLCGA